MIRVGRPLIGWMTGLCLAGTLVVSVHVADAAATDSLSWTTLLDDQARDFGRGEPSLVYDSRRGRVLALCGANDTFCKGGPGTQLFDVVTYFDDVRSIDVSTDSAWQPLAIPPSPRRTSAAAVYDSIGDRVFLFGGGSGSEIWVLHLATATWDSIPMIGSGPVGRWHASLTLDPVRQRLLLFGGNVPGVSALLNDVWEMPLSTPGSWSPIQPTGPLPPARFQHLAAYDAARDRLIITGGSSATAELSDSWAIPLSGTPAWTQIAPPGAGPPGRAMGGIDVPRNRLIAVTSGAGMTVRAMDLATDTWSMATPSGISPLELDTSARLFPRSSAVVDPVHDAIVFSWAVYGYVFGCYPGPQSGWTHVLRMGELPPVNVAASLDSVSFSLGVVSETWTFTLDRTPWSPLILETDEGGPFRSFLLSEVVTSGVVRDSRILATGPAFHERVRWFDGQQSRTTTQVTIVRPPAPVHVGVTRDTMYVQGGWTRGLFHFQSDSLRYLAPAIVEYRVAGVPTWSHLDAGFPEEDGAYAFWDPDVLPNTQYEYRFRWDAEPPPGSPIFAFLTPPAPVFDSSHVENRLIALYWHSVPGAHLVGRIKRDDPLTGAWRDTFDVHTNAEGRILFEDRTVAPGTYYCYQLTWFEGGVERVSTDICLGTTGTPLPPPGPSGPPLMLATPYPNPTAGAFQAATFVPPGPLATAALFDIAGRRRWSGTLAPGTAAIQVPALGLDNGIYTLIIQQGARSESRRLVVVR